jgi:23S rRNA maturation-related 3'-5' exoribonuclease YhaM
MTNEQKRMALYNTITNYLVALQQQNNISASMMEDAINKYLVSLKDQIIQEMLLEIPEEESNIQEEKSEQVDEEDLVTTE